MRSRKSIMFSSFQAVRYSIMIHWKTTRSEAYTIAEQPSSSYTVALQEIGIRDFPNQMGAHAPMHPPAPPNSISYAGNASGAPASANFEPEARFGIEFLMKMWDDTTKTLYYQVGNSQDWANFPGLLSDYDIWRLPQADDDWQGCPSAAHYICPRPVFVAGPAGSALSPNLAGRPAAQFAGNYITKIYDAGYTDTLNLYDVSGLAHFELYRALRVAGNPSGLAVTQQGIRNQLLKQVADAITRAANDAWGFGDAWNSDTTSHGAGIFGDGERSLLLDRIERV